MLHAWTTRQHRQCHRLGGQMGGGLIWMCHPTTVGWPAATHAHEPIDQTPERRPSASVMKTGGHIAATLVAKTHQDGHLRRAATGIPEGHSRTPIGNWPSRADGDAHLISHVQDADQAVPRPRNRVLLVPSTIAIVIPLGEEAAAFCPRSKAATTSTTCATPWLMGHRPDSRLGLWRTTGPGCYATGSANTTMLLT
jgi:hypothetical protein